MYWRILEFSRSAQTRNSGAYGDELTSIAVTELFNVEIDIVSSIGIQGFKRITPHNSMPAHIITLGHFAEDHGMHYVVVNSNEINTEESQESTDHVSDREDISDQPADREVISDQPTDREDINDQLTDHEDISDQLTKP